MSLDSLGMFPYENETARVNRFRPKDSGLVAEFKLCKFCYDRFHKKFFDLVFNEDTCTLYRFLAPVGDEHQRKPPSPPGFNLYFFLIFNISVKDSTKVGSQT